MICLSLSLEPTVSNISPTTLEKFRFKFNLVSLSYSFSPGSVKTARRAVIIPMAGSECKNSGAVKLSALHIATGFSTGYNVEALGN